MSAEYMKTINEYWVNNRCEEKLKRSKALELFIARCGTLHLQMFAYELSKPLPDELKVVDDKPKGLTLKTTKPLNKPERAYLEIREGSRHDPPVRIIEVPPLNKPEEGKVYNLHKLESHNGQWSQVVVQNDPEDEPVPLLDLF